MKCFKVRLWWFSAWFWHSCSPTALNYFWRGNEVQRKEPWFMNSDSNKIHVGGWSARIISWFFILRLLGYDWPEHTKEGQRCKTTAFPSCWWVLLRSRAVPEGNLLLALGWEFVCGVCTSVTAVPKCQMRSQSQVQCSTTAQVLHLPFQLGLEAVSKDLFEVVKLQLRSSLNYCFSWNRISYPWHVDFKVLAHFSFKPSSN